jgi:hypothetical protein
MPNGSRSSRLSPNDAARSSRTPSNASVDPLRHTSSPKGTTACAALKRGAGRMIGSRTRRRKAVAGSAGMALAARGGISPAALAKNDDGEGRGLRRIPQLVIEQIAPGARSDAPAYASLRSWKTIEIPGRETPGGTSTPVRSAPTCSVAARGPSSARGLHQRGSRSDRRAPPSTFSTASA